MIRSSLFSHDDSSVWDPKTLGQILHISDDQLQILNNLPEWSSGITNDSLNLGTTKESIILSSQSSEVGSQISGLENSKIHQSTKNIELFDKDQQYRKTLLETLKLNTRKRNKSSSLIEIVNHNKDLPTLTSLKQASSTPDIHLTNFHPKKICNKFDSIKKHSLNVTYCVSSASQNKSKNIFRNTVEVDSLNFYQNLSIPEYKSNRNRKLSWEDMEVITQQPVNIDALKVNVSSGERFELALEKPDKVSTYAEPEKLSNLHSDKQISNGNENEKDSNHVSVSNSNNEEAGSKQIEKKQGVLSVNAKHKELSDLHNEKEVISDGIENYKDKSSQISSINSEQVEESNDLAFDKVELDSSVKSPVLENDVSNGGQECINLDLKVEKLEFAKEISGSIPTQQSLSGKNSCDVVNTQDSSKSSQAIDISKATPDTLAAAGTPLTFKRKADPKRSSKKRRCLQDKKEEPDASRSLKNAGDIAYSFEDVEILLDLLKQFL